MNEDFIRSAPKPVERPPQVGAIFSSQLDLTPEKKEKSRPKQAKIRRGNDGSKQVVFVEKHENKESYQSLERPVINSSERISTKLQELQETKFNPAVAIAEEFGNSETARTNFAEKVAQAVNIKRDKKTYTDLISLDVVPNDLISSHAHQRLPSRPKPVKPPEIEPDVMDFYCEDLEEESPKFDFSAIEEKEELPIISCDHGFDLYSHMRCWEHTWR